jgi:hypothetical protein
LHTILEEQQCLNYRAFTRTAPNRRVQGKQTKPSQSRIKHFKKEKKYENDIQASISRVHLPFLLKVSMARKKIEGSTLLSAEEVAHKKKNANTC